VAAVRMKADGGLVRRMVLTMFLLGLVYVAFVGVLLALRVNWLIIIAVVVGGFLVQYFYSDKIALYSMHGRVVTPEQAPELHAVVDRLVALTDAPKPQVAIAETDMPNAFATGRNPKRAVLCVTTGLLRRLEPEELEGVISHELAHVAHRDVAVMTIASFLGVIAGMITRMALYVRMGRDRDNNAAAMFFAIVLASAVVYALSFLLIRALSRYRELAADRAGAIVTGRPSALASALVKVTGEMGRIPTRDLRQAEAFNAFFFTPAVARGFSLSSLFATHPPLEHRLEQLGKLAAELGAPA
jgi:heat shock protein HtpX